MFVKGINNLISVANKSVDRVDGVVEAVVKRTDAQRKRGAIVLRDNLAALEGGTVK